MAMIENSLARLRPHLLALLRIVTALLFLQHGLSKLVGFPNPGQKQSSYFTLLGLAAVIEVVGSVLLVVGFRTRLVAFILSGEMAVAYFRPMRRGASTRSPMAARRRSCSASCFSTSPVPAAAAGPSIAAECRRAWRWLGAAAGRDIRDWRRAGWG
jgi:hypothetical protein